MSFGISRKYEGTSIYKLPYKVVADFVGVIGDMVGLNSSGYLEASSNANTFVGLLIGDVDNTGGAAGDKEVLVNVDGKVWLPLAGASLTNLFKPFHATSNLIVLQGYSATTHTADGICVSYRTDEVLIDFSKSTEEPTGGAAPVSSVDSRTGVVTLGDLYTDIADTNGLSASLNERTWYLPTGGGWSFWNPAADEGLQLTSREDDGTFASWLRGEIEFLLRMFDADRVELKADNSILALLGTNGVKIQLTPAAIAGFHGAAVAQATHIANASGGSGNLDTIVNAILVVLEDKGIVASA